ncbi:hypothetical protein EVAR_5123_1 [Eumeta japonica]|uniref:Uncharacterized protein n=1 Tax=Eumeta variegata TaxID=151549 RepID=A0A4C1SUI8_EUMVA|nr:hypothetical protein EVAR_5123_1 [Eumeta japonica]
MVANSKSKVQQLRSAFDNEAHSRSAYIDGSENFVVNPINFKMNNRREDILGIRPQWIALVLHSDFIEIVQSSDCSFVAIGRRRSSPRDHPFSLVCYCVAVFLRAALGSVGLRACMSVGGAEQWTSRGDSKATFVPVIYSGDPAVCTSSPRTVSAPRERSRTFTLQIPIAILVISRVLHAFSYAVNLIYPLLSPRNERDSRGPRREGQRRRFLCKQVSSLTSGEEHGTASGRTRRGRVHTEGPGLGARRRDAKGHGVREETL